MNRRIGLAACFAITFTASGQAPVRRDLMADMQEYVQALGVNCDHCHSAARGSGAAEPKKDTARQMIAMTREINARVEAATGKEPASAVRVSCITCHRGVTIPRQLSDILRQTIREKGSASAVVQYRELRERYFGGASYDFSEAMLVSLAQELSSARPADAITLLELNLEYYPKSSKSYAALGYAYTRKFDDATAIVNYEKALELDPSNGVVQGQLEQLRNFRRRK